MRFTIFLLLLLVLPHSAVAADLVSVAQIVPAPGQPIRELHLVEVRVDLGQSYANPFDPDEIRVTAGFEWPDDEQVLVVDEQVLDGFWFQDYAATLTDGVERLSEVGAPHFRLRWRAREGTWPLRVHATDADGEAVAEPLVLVVEPAPASPPASAERGFVRRASMNGLTWSGGAAYVPFGANVCWVGYDEGTAGFQRYFDRLAENGLNWTRVWMTHFDATTLEWSSGDQGAYQGLGRYNLKAAWRVDRILRLAEQRGIALQLVLQQHSQFETSNWSSWAENPWNQANGGPLAGSGEFFTNPEVIAAFDAKLRYVVARYAHSPGLLAWELFNEVELIQGAKTYDFLPWMHDRAALLHALDPYDHLVTTSYSSPCWMGCSQPWDDDVYDLAQVHTYLPDYWMSLQKAATKMGMFSKPVIVGEAGIDVLGQNNLDDTQGVELVNLTLLSALLGFNGGAMSWWWDNWIEPDNLWSVLGNAARALKAAHIADWGGRLEGVEAEASVPLEVVAAKVGPWLWPGDAVVWLHDPRSDWNGDLAAADAEDVVVSILTIPGPTGCRRAYTLLDPWSQDVVERGCDPSGGIPGPEVRFRRDLLVLAVCQAECGGDGPDEDAWVVPPDAANDIGGTDFAFVRDGDDDSADAASDQEQEADDDAASGSGGCSVTSFR